MYPKVKLGDISKITYGKNLPTKLLKQTGYTVFGANGIIGYFDDYLYEDEMLLISCRGAYSGKINMSPKKSFITNNSLIVDLNCKDSIHKKLVYYFLQAVNKTNIITGTAQPQVTINNVLPLEIPLPPLPTQYFIVSEIEKQFSNLDEGLSSLKRAKENLKKYKASVLKSAVEGKLTEDFRKTQTLESANILLKKILEERKNKFLSENPGKKYKEPEGIKQDDLPNIELPEGWEWCNLEQITTLITDGKHGNCVDENNSGYYFLSAKDVKNGKLIYENSRQINKKEFLEVHNRTNLEPGDICLVNTGATVGKIAIAENNEFTRNTTFQKSVAVIKVLRDYLSNEYINIFLREGTQKLLKLSGGTAVNNLLLSQIKSLKFPLPPLSEQNEIVKIVESKLSVVEKLEKLVEENIKKAENLKQSILKKAFEGELIKE